jgi:hypothetical protein
MEDLHSVRIPRGVEYLYAKFWDLVGAEKISYQELVAYQEATGSPLDPWEIEAIKGMDAEYQAFVGEKTKEATNA